MLGVICLKSCYHLCSPRIFQIESCCPLTTSLKQNWLHRFIFLAAKEPVSLCCGKSHKLVYDFWHLYQVTNTSILTWSTLSYMFQSWKWQTWNLVQNGEYSYYLKHWNILFLSSYYSRTAKRYWQISQVCFNKATLSINCFLNCFPHRLRALSDGNSVTSPPPSPGLVMPKYKLAEHRYGREEMLVLFTPVEKVTSIMTKCSLLHFTWQKTRIGLIAVVLRLNVNWSLCFRFQNSYRSFLQLWVKRCCNQCHIFHRVRKNSGFCHRQLTVV